MTGPDRCDTDPATVNFRASCLPAENGWGAESEPARLPSDQNSEGPWPCQEFIQSSQISYSWETDENQTSIAGASMFYVG
jgi:hypothetical protein